MSKKITLILFFTIAPFIVYFGLQNLATRPQEIKSITIPSKKSEVVVDQILNDWKFSYSDKYSFALNYKPNGWFLSGTGNETRGDWTLTSFDPKYATPKGAFSIKIDISVILDTNISKFDGIKCKQEPLITTDEVTQCDVVTINGTTFRREISVSKEAQNGEADIKVTQLATFRNGYVYLITAYNDFNKPNIEIDHILSQVHI